MNIEENQKKQGKQGMARTIYMPDPYHLLVVKCRKTEDAIIRYAQNYRRDLPDVVRKSLRHYTHVWASKDEELEELSERVRFLKSRRAYSMVREWAFAERAKHSDLQSTKRDAYEIPGGMILDNEFVDYPDNYGEMAAIREMVEETGFIIVNLSTKENFFHPMNPRIATFFEDDYEIEAEGNFRYEAWIYWVTDVVPLIDEKTKKPLFDTRGFPEPRPTGVETETFAAFYMPIEKLHNGISNDRRGNFHFKHAEFMKIALRQKVAKGRKEYLPALEHFEKTFPEFTGLSKKQPKEIPEMPVIKECSGEEAWIRATTGVERI